jgi:hypothetical protein
MAPQQEWEVEVTLGDVSKANAFLKIGDQEYKLRRLTKGDQAACEEFLRSTRASAALEGLRHTSFVDDALTAGVYTEIMAKSLGSAEMWRSSQGEAFLFARGFADPKLSYKQVIDPEGPLKGVAAAQINLAITWMTGTPFDDEGNPVRTERPSSTDSESK